MMSPKGGVHLVCSQASFCNKNTAVGFVKGSQSVCWPLPPVPTVHLSVLGYARHSRSLTKLPPKTDQRKETQGPFITQRGALGAGVSSIVAGTTLSGPSMLALRDPAANQSLRTSQPNSKSKTSDTLSTAHSPETPVQPVLKTNLSILTPNPSPEF